MKTDKYRVIVAKPCMYGMGRPEFLAATLRDAGFEVTYLDLEQEFRSRAAELEKAGANVIMSAIEQTCESSANAAHEDRSDAVCVWIHPAHKRIYPWILDLVKKKGMKDALVFGGTLITPDDAEDFSKEHGVGRLFGPGALVSDVVAYLREELPRRRPARP
jgi:methylmalonyl-CoA mutase, C-terminal domain